MSIRKLPAALQNGWSNYSRSREKVGYRNRFTRAIGMVVDLLLLATLLSFCALLIVMMLFLVADKVKSFGIERSVQATIAIGVFAVLVYKWRSDILSFAYYLLASIYYAGWLLFCLSAVSSVSQGIESFLTAPIGLKPEHSAEGLGSLYLPIGIGAIMVSFVMWIVRGIKRNNESSISKALESKTGR